jgi:hypothetical protein
MFENSAKGGGAAPAMSYGKSATACIPQTRKLLYNIQKVTCVSTIMFILLLMGILNPYIFQTVMVYWSKRFM